MIKEVRKNVVFQTFDNKYELQEKMLYFITNSKLNNIFYIGNPNDVGYKNKKRILITDVNFIIEPSIIKDKFNDLITSTGNKDYCIIYKETTKYN